VVRIAKSVTYLVINLTNYSLTRPECCRGHYEFDQLMDFTSGNKSAGIGPTNREVLDGINSGSNSYSMSYMYSLVLTLVYIYSLTHSTIYYVLDTTILTTSTARTPGTISPIYITIYMSKMVWSTVLMTIMML